MKKRMKKNISLLLAIHAILTFSPSNTSIFPIPESTASDIEKPDISVFDDINTTQPHHTPAHIVF